MSPVAAADESEIQGFHAESRSTKDGRRITYEATVIQNPEKARACGQGAKCMQLISRAHDTLADRYSQLLQTDAP